MQKFVNIYQDIITTENLLRAWEVFLRGKKQKKDVILFQVKLMDNIFQLQRDLANKRYQHGKYHAFNISDPKPRNIHKASVRDRLLHHLLYQELYAYFDAKFIYDSYSCRVSKGTHRAVRRFEQMARKVSRNNTRTCWVLKCDIKKFFANIDHITLKTILEKYIDDRDLLCLLGKIIDSFHTKRRYGAGLPLGNLTSQLLVNIYMNEFDQFVKRRLKVRYYIRFADDFIVLDRRKEYLDELIIYFQDFLENRLKLNLHENKVFIKTLSTGVDFLGWIQFPHHRVLRTTTKRRMLKNIRKGPNQASLASYIEMLKHGNGYSLHLYIEQIQTKVKSPRSIPRGL